MPLVFSVGLRNFVFSLVLKATVEVYKDPSVVKNIYFLYNTQRKNYI